MKTLGHTLMILLAFALLMGLMYVAVNAASGSSAVPTAPTFERDRGAPPRSDGARPPEFRGEHERRGGGWMFGMIRNTGIVAFIVALIVIPKNLWRRRIKNVSASVG